jgi:hypothetical protein
MPMNTPEEEISALKLRIKELEDLNEDLVKEINEHTEKFKLAEDLLVILFRVEYTSTKHNTDLLAQLLPAIFKFTTACPSSKVTVEYKKRNSEEG